MDVASLGFRTDLALLELAGSVIEDRGDHLVVTTPSNPAFYWGNFLLLERVPPAGAVEEWLARFAATFPGARHRALGFDDPHGSADDLAGFAARGLDVDVATVMLATAVNPPPHPNPEATYRPLRSDDDWAQSVSLAIASGDTEESEEYLEFVERRTASNRALCEDGQGAWFGAFLGGRLVAQLGLVGASPGLARFQSVETHPDHRRRGLAGTLVHRASEYGFAELGATTLVMVADPGYHAIRVYRSLGFTDGETQLQVEQAPG